MFCTRVYNFLQLAPWKLTTAEPFSSRLPFRPWIFSEKCKIRFKRSWQKCLKCFKFLYMFCKMYFVKEELEWTRGKHVYPHSSSVQMTMTQLQIYVIKIQYLLYSQLSVKVLMLSSTLAGHCHIAFRCCTWSWFWVLYSMKFSCSTCPFCCGKPNCFSLYNVKTAWIKKTDGCFNSKTHLIILKFISMLTCRINVNSFTVT